MEELNDTNTEEELPLEDELSDSTSDDESGETVETFDDALESAETDEDLAAIANQLRDDVEEEVKEPEPIADEEVKGDIDTETEDTVEPSFNIGKGFAIKDGDIELNITDENKLRQLAQMGLNYGGKTTELAKHRSFVKYAEDNNISLDDIQMLRDIKGGNKEAYSALGVNSKIDVYDIKEEHTYAPDAVVLPQHVDPMVDVIAQEILDNAEHTSQFQKWLPHMPDDVRTQVTSDAGSLRAVQADIASGVFDKAMNQAYSDMRVNGAEFNTAYLRAKEMIVGTQSPTPTPQAPITRGERQRASASRGKASSQKTFSSVADMSDDDFLNNFQDIVNGLERPQG